MGPSVRNPDGSVNLKNKIRVAVRIRSIPWDKQNDATHKKRSQRRCGVCTTMNMVSVVTYGHMDAGLCGSRSTMIHCCKCAHDTGLTNQLPLPPDCNRAIGPWSDSAWIHIASSRNTQGPVCVADHINRIKLKALFAQTRPIVCRLFIVLNNDLNVPRTRS